MRLKSILNCLTNTVIHDFLTVSIVRETSMSAVVRVSPRLMIAITGIRIRLQTLCILNEIGQVRLKRGCETRLLTHLLEGDIAPRLVGYDARK